MKILMADDDRDDFIILQEAAEKAGEDFEITYTSNWLELWRSVMKALPDAIFLDLNMPVKDGIECLKLLRAEGKYDKLPVIIYSTSTNKNDIDKAYEAGANYYIIKPDSFENTVGI